MAHSNLASSPGDILTSANANRFLYADGSGDFSITSNTLTLNALQPSATLVINESGGDFDIRIEGSGNANLMYFDAGNDRIGVGTTTPDALLHIAIAGEDNSSGTFGNLMLSSAADELKRLNIGWDQTNEHGFIQSIHSGTAWKPLQFSALSYDWGINAISGGMVLDATGLGIGRAPTALLDIYSGASADVAVIIASGVNGYATRLNIVGNDATGSRDNEIISKYGATQQWKIGSGAADATMTFSTSTTLAMTIDSSQDITIASGKDLNAAAGHILIDGVTDENNHAFWIKISGSSNIWAISNASDDLRFNYFNGSTWENKFHFSNSHNLGINTSTFGSSADSSLAIAIGTEPGSSIAGQIELYAKDSSDGATNATVGLRTEQGVEAIGTFTPSHKLKLWINGTEYWVQLDAV